MSDQTSNPTLWLVEQGRVRKPCRMLRFREVRASERSLIVPLMAIFANSGSCNVGRGIACDTAVPLMARFRIHEEDLTLRPEDHSEE